MPNINNTLKKENYTILCPNMAPIHFKLIESVFRKHGYNLILLSGIDKFVSTEMGLKYVNNDMCYPCVLITGELLTEILSGKYDLTKTAILNVQTGGSCRATNYNAVIEKALKHLKIDIPILSVSAFSFENSNNKFKISISMLKDLVYVIGLGDLLNNCAYHCRANEINKGETNKLLNNWIKQIYDNIDKINFSLYRKYISKIIADFEMIKLADEKKPLVGIVGEIYVKWNPTSNNHLHHFLEKESCEVVPTPLMTFFFYCLTNLKIRNELFLENKTTLKEITGIPVGLDQTQTANLLIQLLQKFYDPINKGLEKSTVFRKITDIDKMSKLASQYLSLGNQSGEGWLLVSDILDYLDNGIDNIVCVQPFGCLPNHIIGKGIIKAIRDENPTLNIAPIDYDPGASEINQNNRLLLMISVAKSKIIKEKKLLKKTEF